VHPFQDSGAVYLVYLYMSRRLCGIIIIFACFLSDRAFAQYDTSYYVSYHELLTGRVYFSRKYTSLRFWDRNDDIKLFYFPNTNLNMGVGATYHALTVNLAYGFGFLNPEQGRGETKYLDLQTHIYGRRLQFDIFGQFYDGFYLTNRELRDSNGDYYTRPDIKVREFGFAAQYIMNHKRFSFRAGFFQDEWQKKSAGSLLFGWQILYGIGTSDSTIVPASFNGIPSVAQDHTLTFFETGPGVGYAHTFVIKKHFFIMLSGTINFGFGFNKVVATQEQVSRAFFPNFGFRSFAGYNSEQFAISITFTDESMYLGSADKDRLLELSTGNLRLNFAHRFRVRSR
jgi:hypothetical protein